MNASDVIFMKLSAAMYIVGYDERGKKDGGEKIPKFPPL